MSLSMLRGVCHSLLLVTAGTIIASSAQAQGNRPAQLPPGAVVQPLPNEDGAELRRHLTTLADNPDNLDALIGAGRAALDGADTQAALTFFSRASELAPRDPRVKAGMGSVLVRMERGQPAINLFNEAVALGAPVAEIAGDRGLAYDMIGDPRHAQQDYALVLQRHEDPEVRRRLALSLAISGERDAALRAIDGQLRRNDRAAWRTQAFILALTGDAAGANRTAVGMMPPGAAEAMAPFFARLPGLTPSQKAMAAHFGRFPNDSRTGLASAGDTRADPGALALATGRSPSGTTRPVVSEPSRQSSRRRPGQDGSPASARTPTQERSVRSTAEQSPDRPVQLADAQTPRQATSRPQAQQTAQPGASGLEPSLPERQPQPGPSSGRSASTTTPINSTTTGSLSSPIVQTRVAPVDEAAAQGTVQASEHSSSQPQESSRRAQDQQAERSGAVSSASDVARPTVPTVQRSTALADIAAVVAALPEDQDAPLRRTPASTPTRPAAQPTGRPSTSGGRSPAPTPSASRTGAATSPARRPANPSRHWVQIAGGANAAALPRELARLRAQAPELVNRNAWVTPANATNRLLVGPFGSLGEAQAFVNVLAARNLSSFAWTSPPGQEIARLQTGR